MYSLAAAYHCKQAQLPTPVILIQKSFLCISPPFALFLSPSPLTSPHLHLSSLSSHRTTGIAIDCAFEKELELASPAISLASSDALVSLRDHPVVSGRHFPSNLLLLHSHQTLRELRSGPFSATVGTWTGICKA